MIDLTLLEQYFHTLLFFDFGDFTLVGLLAVFGASLTWLIVKAIKNLFSI